MGYELNHEKKIECRTRFRIQHEQRGSHCSGGSDLRCIEKEKFLNWNYRKQRNARQKGKLSIHAGQVKWKHKKKRRIVE